MSESKFTCEEVQPPRDTRIVYGAGCTWWDSIDNVGSTNTTGISLPCCPHCSSVLFEVRDEATWFKGVDRHEAAGNPGYRAMIEWGRGRCFRNFQELRAGYQARGLFH